MRQTLALRSQEASCFPTHALGGAHEWGTAGRQFGGTLSHRSQEVRALPLMRWKTRMNGAQREEKQVPFGYAQGRLSTHHPQTEKRLRPLSLRMTAALEVEASGMTARVG